MKNYLLDVRIHIAVGILCFIVALIAYIAVDANGLSDLPVYAKVALWIFAIILFGNVGARVVMAWIILPVMKLYTKRRD